jgi:hypothetical protein
MYLVPGTTYVLKLFFRMVVPGTDCGQKNFEKFFGPKKGDLEPGQITKKIFF